MAAAGPSSLRYLIQTISTLATRPQSLEATASVAWLLSLGGQLYLESDVTDRDRHGRLLSYVWLDIGDRVTT
jgi:hypothetical protein